MISESSFIDGSDSKSNKNLLFSTKITDNSIDLNRQAFSNIIEIDNRNNTKNRAVFLVSIKKHYLLITTYGKEYAECIANEIGLCIEASCNPCCSLYQISNDCFIIYISEYKNKIQLTCLANQILLRVSSNFMSKILGCRIGILELGSMKYDAEKIIKNASIACEISNDNQFFGFTFFENTMLESIFRATEIKTELFQAISNEKSKSIYVEYQPIVNVLSDQIVGFEALARFNSKRFGIVSPAEFIPLCEESQQIIALGENIMFKAFNFLKRAEKLDPDLSLFINISLVQLLSDDFVDETMKLIETTDVSPVKIMLEITETVFSKDYEKINNNLQKFKDHGINIAIDDFGTGYSSFARERELNVNYLKIDKSFFDNLLVSDDKDSIVEYIIKMAHKLGQCVVAEGIENEYQKEYLKKNDCDLMQGYLFSKPLNDELALNRLLHANVLL